MPKFNRYWGFNSLSTNGITSPFGNVSVASSSALFNTTSLIAWNEFSPVPNNMWLVSEMDSETANTVTDSGSASFDASGQSFTVDPNLKTIASDAQLDLNFSNLNVAGKTIFSILRQDTGTAMQPIRNGGAGMYMQNDANGNGYFRTGFGDAFFTYDSNVQATVFEWYLLEAQITSNTVAYYINGTKFGDTYSVTGTPFDGTVFNQLFSSTANGWYGDVVVVDNDHAQLPDIRRRMASSVGAILDGESADAVNIVIMGQSNGSQLMTYAERKGYSAAQRVLGLKTGYGVRWLNTAISGTRLVKSLTAATTSWWDDVNDIPNTHLTNAINSITSWGQTPDVVIWSQGEADATFAALDAAEYELSLGQLFDHIYGLYGCQIVVNLLGRRTDGSGLDAQSQAVTEAHLNVIAAKDFVYKGAEQYHVPLQDGVHFTDDGYGAIGTLTGRSLVEAGGLESVTTRPSLTSASKSGDTVVMSLSSVSGWAVNGTEETGTVDITPTEASQFIVTGTSGKLTPTGISFNASTSEVTLTYSAGLLDTEGTLNAYVGYGCYPTGATMDLTKLVTDNSTFQFPVERTAAVSVT